MKRSGTGRHTLKDIAAKAGVSVVAASVALNPSMHSRAKVSEATRKKVIRIAERCNYKPNMFASGLRQKRTGRIGFAADRYNDLANNELKHRVLRASIEQNTPMHFLNYDQYSTAASMIRDMLSHDFEKLIIFRFWDRMDAAERAALAKRFGDRLLVIDYTNDADRAAYGISFMYTDFSRAWNDLFSHLVQSGFTRTAVLTYEVPPSAPGADVFVSPQDDRFRQLTKTFGRKFFNCDRDVFRTDVTSPDTVYRTTRAIIDAGYDCIKIHNDQIAPIVYKAVHDAGKIIPDDIGIAGFDDIYFAQYLTPPLTTIRNDFDAYTREIFTWLKTPSRSVVIPYAVMERDSTARNGKRRAE